jgi:hypothetical protein
LEKPVRRKERKKERNELANESLEGFRD